MPFDFPLVLRLGHLLTLVGAVAGAVVALGVLLSGSAPPLHVALPQMFPFAKMSLSVDGLSAFFLLVVSLVAAAAAIYGPRYLGAHAKFPFVQVLALNVFVGCMALVCCAGDALTFLLAWEGMTLASYVLVVSDTESEENARAGLLYLVMAHAGTAALLVVFLTLVDHAQAFDFGALGRRRAAWTARRAPRYSCSPWPDSAPRRGWCLCTSGCRRRTQRRPATCRRSCRV